MSFFDPPPRPQTRLAYHRVLSPTASVKVSPICLGGISIGNEWSELFGESEDAFTLLDQFFELGGNFIDTSNTYNAESSERLIGEWMKARGVRDQMVVATKYTAGYRAHNREREPLQSNFTGNSAKSMFVSVRDSLRKLDTDYIDILYVHWWDFTTSVEEVMRHLHAYVMARQVLYLGVSDTPAWVVVKANEYARRHGLTPFSVYQGKWNAAFRDMEAEIIPMCEDQGMGIVPWAALGGGQLLTAEQRRQREEQAANQKSFYTLSKDDISVCEALEKIAADRSASLQSIALAYLFHQSTYVFPIVGVQTTAHVRAMEEALAVKLSQDEIRRIQEATHFNPLFPMNFLYPNQEGKGYSLQLTAADNVQYQMSAWIDVPGRPPAYEPHSTPKS
ncbi:NADP-dependent oxidoreductase domain-containing protein [Truncatella angustata]|uniref:NADP-dependent oxidoreductase domain-containing protein n=1 Tax=Truncatella angustata TaxID=152316 RepID=A0A9P8UCI0_9PEZI|nr:NADP-dependent oxidoreductase domain-containing protein [Truncatella angustata]KAH6646716.1 NADP-dependent oxidoreductase domain-containing protein [Truncatella angustata]